MASPPPPKGRALPTKGKGRGLKSGNTRAYQGLMSNDNGMFDTGESDKENDGQPEAAPVENKRKAPLGEKMQSNGKKTKTGVEAKRVPFAELKQPGAQETDVKKAEGCKRTAAKKSGTDPKEGAGQQHPRGESSSKTKYEEAKVEDVKSEQDAQPKAKPTKKLKATWLDKTNPESGAKASTKAAPLGGEEAETDMSKPKPAGSKDKTKIVPTSSEVAEAVHDIMSRNFLKTEDIANMPTQLRDFIGKEKNPNVLQRAVNNAENSREDIKNQVNQLKLSKSCDKATTVEKIDIADEVKALNLQGKFISALSQLAQLQLRKVQSPVGEEDVHMSDVQDVEKTGD